MLTFPTRLKPISGGFAPSTKSLGGGQSLSGFEQVSSQLSDRWMASYAFAIREDADVLAFRAFVLSMRGRANSVLLPAFDLARAPWAVDAFGRQITPSLRRTPQLDGTPYADASSLRDSLISAKLHVAALLNSTTVIVDMVAGSAPQPGHLFSIGTKLHSVLTVTGSGPYTLGIWPWLRADAAVDVVTNFATPASGMRFASDTEGTDALAALSQLRFGTITLKFDEVA
jgi:hypothetical protein